MTGSWSEPPDLTGTLVAFGDCIRCGRMFPFNPEMVPSTTVHPDTRCNIRPDGTPVRAGHIDGVREPLCPSCAEVFRAAGGQDQPLLHLFPMARTDRIDLDAAKRIQAGAS